MLDTVVALLAKDILTKYSMQLRTEDHAKNLVTVTCIVKNTNMIEEARTARFITLS